MAAPLVLMGRLQCPGLLRCAEPVAAVKLSSLQSAIGSVSLEIYVGQKLEVQI
jgi:hypothetical protein